MESSNNLKRREAEHIFDTHKIFSTSCIRHGIVKLCLLYISAHQAAFYGAVKIFLRTKKDAPRQIVSNEVRYWPKENLQRKKKAPLKKNTLRHREKSQSDASAQSSDYGTSTSSGSVWLLTAQSTFLNRRTAASSSLNKWPTLMSPSEI